MENWIRMTGKGWLPSKEDLLQLRARTSGFVETKVQVKDWVWQLVDVGGQRVERKKWPAITANRNAILFWASLNDYDAEPEVGNMKTRMHESLGVWAEVVQSPDAGNVPIVLFLNKRDLFEKRLEACPMQEKWPDFDPPAKRGKELVSAATSFVMAKYLKCLTASTSCVQPESVYVHVTCALDTDQMRVVSFSIRDFVIQQRLRLINAV